MADLASLRQAMVRLGLTQEAADFATDDDHMGLSTLDAWRDFHTDEHLKSFAENLRKPGGTIVQGGNEVPRPGFPVSVLAISNIKVMRLGLKHYQNITRTITAAQINEDWVAEWDFLVEWRKDADNKKPHEDELPKINMKDWAKTKVKIIDYFAEVYGRDGIPLGYILREDATVRPEANDPRANYGEDHIKELIARAPHTGGTYRADNRTMCRLLKKMCIDTPAYEHISRFTADGRAAWIALKDAYLGPQHTQNQAAIYEAKIQNATYEGESSRFNFDSFYNIHKEGKNILEGLMEHGYAGMDEGTHLRHFLNGIKNDKLKTVVEVVRGNDEYDTLESAARRIKDAVITMNPTRPTRRVAAVVVKNKKGEEVFPGVEPDTTMDDKYFTPAEWSKLSAAKKKGVLLKRQGRPGNPKKQKKSEDPKYKAMNKKISSIARDVKAMKLGKRDAESSDSESEEASPPPKKKQKKSGKRSNRNHPATTRRQRSGSESSH